MEFAEGSQSSRWFRLIIAICLLFLIVWLLTWWLSGDDTADSTADPVVSPSATAGIPDGNPVIVPSPSPTVGPCVSPSPTEGTQPGGSRTQPIVCPPVDDPLASDTLFPGHLPALADCGDPGVPMIGLGSSVTLPDGRHYACIVVGSTVDATVGVRSSHGGTGDEPDLRFTLHRFDALGDPVAVGFADDTVGTDPRLSMELEAGTYLVDLDAFGAATGVVVVYTEIP